MANHKLKSRNRYLTSERSEHEKVNLQATVHYCVTSMNLDDFPKISDHFVDISEDIQNVIRRSYQYFRTFFTDIFEDCRGKSEVVSA